MERGRKLLQNALVSEARNKAIAEAVEGIAPELVPEDLSITVLCECVNKLCREEITIPLNEYQKIHEDPMAFTVAEEHYLPQFEEMIHKNDDYMIIRKKPEALDDPFEL